MFTGWELGITISMLGLALLVVLQTIFNFYLFKKKRNKDTELFISKIEDEPVQAPLVASSVPFAGYVAPVARYEGPAKPVDISAVLCIAQLLAIKEDRPQIVTITQQPGQPVSVKMEDQPKGPKTNIAVQVIDTRPIPNPYVSVPTNYTDDELRTLLSRRQAISDINDPNSKMSKDLEVYLKERQERKQQHIEDVRKKAEENAREKVKTDVDLMLHFTEQAKASSEYTLFELIEKYIQEAGKKAEAVTRARYTY